MNEYIEMWQRYADFSGRTTVRGYWMAYLFNFLASSVLSLIATAVPELSILSSIYSLAVLIPGIAIAVRRFRDAGYSWTSYFWLLVPIVGWIIVIVRLCKPSVIEDSYVVG